ncbi:CU044_2847 family protein [Pantanalinema rosaneae CENA516]|uniref:CU044_2847 family protein n=1 Tax=Pantanalinema rosaneae TaxID=1620701 RepID=UPI003D6E0307
MNSLLFLLTSGQQGRPNHGDYTIRSVDRRLQEWVSVLPIDQRLDGIMAVQAHSRKHRIRTGMTTDLTDPNEPILVEFTLSPGLQPGMEDVGIQLPSPTALAERSTQAINSAMGTMRSMANRVVKTMQSLPVAERPAQVEVQFGMKLTAEGNAAIAKAGAESTITVKLVWDCRTATSQ